MVVSAVMFDLDGTLLDSLADLATSMNRSLERFDLPQHDIDAYRKFVGDGIVTLVHRVAPSTRHDPQLLHGILIEMKNQYQQHWADQTRPYPGIPELLDQLTQRKIPKAVCSNKPHEFTLLCVKKLLAAWQFDQVLGVEEGRPPKPDPSAPLMIAKELNIAPERFLYLGDTNTDMRTARAAGMIPIGVLWGFRSKEELQKSGAEILLSHPLQLLDILSD